MAGIEEARQCIGDSLHLVRNGLQPSSTSRLAIEKLAGAIEALADHIEGSQLHEHLPYMWRTS